jgi:hypothetical protein
MNRAIGLVLVLALFGCDKKAEPASSTSTSATAAAKSAAPAAPAPSAAEAPASAAPSAAATEEKEEQEGLEKGEVVVGYIQDLKDEGQCAALPAKESEKAKYDQKKLEEVAKMMHAKVVPSCPSIGVQGTCRMMGMLVNYVAPKYTIESAKKHCTQNRGKWID